MLNDSKSVEDDSYGGNEVHEVMVKKNAYKTSRIGGYSSSSSSSSSSNSGYGYGVPSQSSSYSSSSSSSHGGSGYGTGYGPSGYGQSGYDQSVHDPSYGTGYSGYPSGSNEHSGYQSNVQLAPFGGSGRVTDPSAPPPPPLPPTAESYRNSNYGRVTSRPHNSNACTTKPQSILNASTRCTVGANTCMVQCMNGYQFPNGETKARMICTNEEWTLENLEWSNKLACERM